VPGHPGRAPDASGPRRLLYQRLGLSALVAMNGPPPQRSLSVAPGGSGDPMPCPAPPDLPSVSVIIPTHNRADLVELVVLEVLEDPGATQVVVAADGCTDSTIPTLGQVGALDPRLKILALERRGKLAAIEAAIAVAEGEVLLFLDDDVIPGPGLVTGHARHHQARAGLVVAGYMPVVSPRQDRTATPTALYATEYEANSLRMQQHPESVLRSLWGGNLSIRSDDCRRVGFSSPNYPDLYHEDQELGLRCAQGGLTGVFDRNLRAYHAHRASHRTFLRDAQSQGAGQWLLHSLHPDLMGPFNAERFTSGLPGPARLIVRASRRPMVAAGTRQGLAGLAATAQWFGAQGLESLALRLARRVEQQRGALMLARGRRRPEEMSRRLVGAGQPSS